MLPYINIADMKIPMYGLCIVVGIGIAAILIMQRCKIRKLCWEDSFVIIFSGLIAGVLGAKLLFVFVTYSFDEIVNFIATGENKIFSRSGLVFYGGLIFGLIGAYVGAKIAGTKLLTYESVIVPVIPLAHAFGRLGCLFSGCCYGETTDSFCRIVYTNPVSDAPRNVPLVPVQAYEALLNLCLFFLLGLLADKVKRGSLLCMYILLYAMIRFVVEFWRFDAVRGKLGVFSTSQWISLVMFTISAAFLMGKSIKEHKIKTNRK